MKSDGYMREFKISELRGLGMASKTSILDIFLVLVSELIVVVNLFEYWSVPITADHCGHIPGMYLCVYVKVYVLLHIWHW